MAECSPVKKSGCGIFSAVFGKHGLWPRRSTSTGSLHIIKEDNKSNVNTSNTYTERRRSGSDEAAFFGPEGRPQKPITKLTPKVTAVYQQNPVRKHVEEPTRTTTTGTQGHGIVNGNINRKVPKESISLSGELEGMIADHQKTRGMIYGNLGNLRQPGNTNTINAKVDDVSKPNGKLYPNTVMGNVVKKPVEEKKSASLCRALSTRMDPETLKFMGNEDYKNGNFAEALALYDAAIAIDPNKAAYRSNKSAALAALGRLVEAVFECREAIIIEPHYHRAHHRLANLYLRLGDVEKAIYHYQHADLEADKDDIAKARNVQAHLNKCTEAKRRRDWDSLVKETDSAINGGADSAPQIFALKAEALLKLHRHEDADETLLGGPNFEVDDLNKYYGPIGNANLLVVRAQVDMAAGRFDEALEAIQRAVKLDPNNKEASSVMRKARAVAFARSNGNEHFKASKFPEACAAYVEGLDHDPHNSILLCNRAACWSKLGHFEKAVDDCTHALHLRAGYTKARLRRADCNSKLKKWEASIQDYTILLRETPNNEEVKRGLLEAQMQLKKQRGGVV
ncbi:inactive TPR repeat-containing thioredoxin TTL3-like [Hibiscus syriacus]|uniref:inactive TPR repeat-containing thioredoxin TTL3-like n=1 Tax=Hibiscus syriacus TaxID=106335 RepID=UPI001924D1BB|nr:inactive TPR repeat-containing thioredoxin TTL3-like [Hibiscus syriacus]